MMFNKKQADAETDLEILRHKNRMKQLSYIRETEERIFQWRIKVIIEKGNSIAKAELAKTRATPSKYQ